MGSRTSGVAAVERMVALCDVVKASAEDLEWLYPGAAVLDVLARWRRLGPELVVVTDGGAGLHALIRGGEPLHLAPKPVRLVDTVGAGDAFMSGLINALVRTDLLSQADPSEGLAAVLAEASLVAGLTCARAGADPPTAAELAAAQAP
jgi:fructokinase